MRKIGILSLSILVFTNLLSAEMITRSVCSNYGINVGQSMYNAGSSYYPNNIVTKVFFQGNIKQTDLIATTGSGTAMYTINHPGRYYVASDLTINQTEDATIGIKITASNVILDINTKTIKHVGTDTASHTFNTIQIDPGVSNVMIANGTMVSNGSNLATGIYLHKTTTQTANNIELSSLSISKFNNGGIREESTLTNPISNGLTVSNVYIRETNGNSTTITSPFSITRRANVIVQNSTFNNNIQDTFSANDYRVFNLSNCPNVKISNCDVSFNKTGTTNSISVYGYYFLGCNNLELSYCNSSTNGAYNGNCYGYYFSQCGDVSINSSVAANIYGWNLTTLKKIVGFYLDCYSSKLDSCRASNITNFKSTDLFDINGFLITSTGTEVRKCEALNIFSPKGGNSSGSIICGFTNYGNNCIYSECKAQNIKGINNDGNIGFRVKYGRNNKFDKCVATNAVSYNVSTTGTGFYFSQETNSIISNCEISNNGCLNLPSTVFGIGAGIIFDDLNGGCSSCLVLNNRLVNNFGQRQYGFVDWTYPTKNILIGNYAIGQGDTNSALSADGKTIVDSSGITPFKHNYLISYKYEQVPSSIKETASENMDALSTSDKYHNISVYLRS